MVLERLQGLVEEEKRKERLGQLVWRWSWLAPLAVLLALLILAYALQTAFSIREVVILMRKEITYFLAEKAVTRIVIVPRTYGPEQSQGYVASAAVVDKALAEKFALQGPVDFLRNPMTSPAAWTVGVSMKILPDGSLHRAVLLKASPSDAINKAACNALKHAFPIFPPPAEALFSVRSPARLVRWIRFHHDEAAIIDQYDMNSFASSQPAVDCATLTTSKNR